MRGTSSPYKSCWFDRRPQGWATYVVALLIPTVLIHGGISFAISSGAIIGGDPIESRGVQLQMIARVAQRNPDGISDEAKRTSRPSSISIRWPTLTSQQDADPVKSSGIQAKKVSYKWRTVTPEDMTNFNKVWFEIVKDNPIIALDALLAKCFRILQCERSAVRIDGLLRDQRLRAEKLHMDQGLQP